MFIHINCIFFFKLSFQTLNASLFTLTVFAGEKIAKDTLHIQKTI